ncbi:MAG TPA: hypothetical protein PKO06_17645, partial [Candidatus Ozemobacteraceae bacterium]|nr:hypothetical protein [Candidatus Ozemobacteraceae bacterium]
MRCESGPVSEQILTFYADTRAVADVQHPMYGDALDHVLEAIVAPRLGIDTLLHDLKTKALRLDSDRLDQLHGLLAAIVSDLRTPVVRELAQLPIWPDRDGSLGCLSGPDSVFIPADPDIAALFPKTRFLHARLLNHPLLEQVKVRRFGAAAVCQAFSETSEDEFRLKATPANVERVQAYLLSHADEVRLLKPERLLKQPLFRSQRGDFAPAEELKIPSDPAILEFARFLPRCRMLDLEDRGYELLKVFGLEKQIAPYQVDHLVEDVVGLWQSAKKKEEWARSFPPLYTLEGIRRFFTLVMASYRSIPQLMLGRLLNLPIFPDEEGVCGILRDKSGWHPRAVFPCVAELRPIFRTLKLRLLDEQIQNLAWPVLQGIPGWAYLDVLVEHPELRKPYTGEGGRKPHQEEAFLCSVIQYLVEHRTEVLREFPPTPRKNLPPANSSLNACCIWPTRAGKVLSAGELFEGETLDLLIDPDSPEDVWCRERMLIDAVRPAFRALQPGFAPADVAEVIDELVGEFAKADEPLANQNPFLSTVQRVAIVFQYLDDRYSDDVNRRDTLPVVDAGGRLVFRALFTADESTLDLVRGLGGEGVIMDPAFKACLPKSVFRQQRFPAYPTSDVILHVAVQPITKIHGGEPPAAGAESGTVPAALEPCRGKFIDWLMEHESDVFQDLVACDLLRRAKI